MKVRCKLLLDSVGRRQESSPTLTLDKTYHVLSVILDVHGTWLVRLIADDNEMVGLFPLRLFEVTSATVPGSWIATWNERGVFELTAEQWNSIGFWDRFYDRDADALRVFEQERERIVASDP